MKKRTIISMCVVALLTSSLVGCGGDDTKTKTGAKENTNEVSKSQESDGREMEGNLYLTGFPLVKEKETIKVAAVDWWNSSDYNEKTVIKNYEEKTNVHVEWSQITDNEQVNLMIASNDLPDAFMCTGPSNAEKYGKQGVLLAVEDLVDQYAPNLKQAFAEEPDIKKMVTSENGHMYSLPTIFRFPDEKLRGFPTINTKWLENVGKEMPTTVDEFYEVLKAFKEQDANGNGDSTDEIPFTLEYENSIRGINALMGPWGVSSSCNGPFILKDDKVAATTMTEEYKEAIKFFNKLYVEGLLDPESFTQDSSKFSAKVEFEENKVGVYPNWNSYSTKEEEKGVFEAILPLEGPSGKSYIGDRGYGIFTNNHIVASSSNAKLVMRWMDGIYDKEESLQWNKGPFGTHLTKLENGKIEIDPEGEETRIDETFVFPVLGLTSTYVENQVINPPAVTHKMELTKKFMPSINMYYISNKLMKFTEEDVNFRSTYEKDIADYMKTKEVEWIINGNIDDQWDDYLKTLKDMKVEELLKVYQDAYERFNNLK